MNTHRHRRLGKAEGVPNICGTCTLGTLRFAQPTVLAQRLSAVASLYKV